MNWYGGSIAEAVSLSMQRNAIFVVFIEGDNDLTVQMAEAINDLEVVNRLSNENDFLAIKLKSGSDNYMHFATIYQLVPVPSLFFISRNGTPLEVVGGGVQANNLAQRIDRILTHHKSETVQPTSSSIKEQSSNLIQAESSAVPAAASATASAPLLANMGEPRPETSSSSSKEYSVVCDGDVCVRVPKDGAGSSAQIDIQEVNPQQTDSTASMEEKMRKAKELIEARRLEKVEKEKELERQKEIEIRAAAQGVAELKRWQHEQELKQIQEERTREKMENKLARQRILEQIAQDRAERRARDQPQPAQDTHTPEESSPDPGPGPGARIQLKLPDGSSHCAHFPADAPLRQLQDYVSHTLQLSMSSHSLWMAFPRRELTESDSTLRALQLAPSAALLVLPRGTNAAPQLPSTYDNIVSLVSELLSAYVFSPCRRVLQYIWGAPNPSAGPRRPAADERPPNEFGGVRRRNNIHRLPGDRAGEDDNNTWNGNSTQQM